MLTRLSEKVWQSNQAEARRLCENGSEAWIREGFKAVVCPAFNVRIPYHPRIAALLLPVWDDTDAPGIMYETAARFHRDFGPTLVHCNGGLNRSSAFAAALLITDGLSIEEAVRKIHALPEAPLLTSLRRWAENHRRVDW
jgi:hypothetical protein